MKKYIFLSAALLLFTASCSNDDNNNETKEQVQAVQFSFTNEDFGEDEAVTRANAAGAKPQIVDLGDCEAEITVESEPTAKTRGALSPANGHYTIRAYQAGTLKDEMKGTFSGGTFTPDASSNKKLRLPYGTYDFVAFNDDVTASGTNLTTTRDKAETARMGFATVTITGPTPIQVQFTMKHVGCRLRTQFVCKKDIPNNITATLEGAAANVIPISVTYNPSTKAYTGTNGAMTPESSNSPASTETKYNASRWGENYTYTSTSTDYHYFLPTTEASNLKLSFSAGTLFWKPLTATQKLNIALSMLSNKSYLVKIKLKPQFTYLFTDGTTGYFKETTQGGGSKTPIAVVVDKDLQLAVALNNASNTEMHWGAIGGVVNVVNNSATFSTLAAALTDMDGYKWTWEPSGSADGVTVKANDPQCFAFYSAGHYSPTLPTGVTLTNGMENKKWYLPAFGEWKYVYTGLGFSHFMPDFSPYSAKWYGNLADLAFTQVGGTSIQPPYYKFWTSTEGNEFSASLVEVYPAVMGVRVGNIWKNQNYKFWVRPFIRY
ncbi:hypothetical protein [Hoylesella enoeca]|uniref:Fimbrillin n=1 Tax=Hoylesella enoeca TaxID=76123 RepID=A0A0S2KLK4_9BACT|nr:hypothetical protein [Hoylesella enoeca]ALO49176.1 hypothetical protein AS203_08820 [Hoylesella enoeca]